MKESLKLRRQIIWTILGIILMGTSIVIYDIYNERYIWVTVQITIYIGCLFFSIRNLVRINKTIANWRLLNDEDAFAELTEDD